MAWSGLGAGTPADPYQIDTLARLQEMKDYLAASYKLMNDIDASATATWNEIPGSPGTYYGFQPIGWTAFTWFKGTFDGNNKTISNLYVNRTAASSNYAGGLFGLIYWETGGNAVVVKDVTLTNASVSLYSNGGILAGSIDSDGPDINKVLITNCHVAGTLTTTYRISGGLIGYAYIATIAGCSSSATVVGTTANGYDASGGLIGQVGKVAISDSFATGAVSGRTLVGGLVGRVISYATSSITDCYATGAVTCTGTGDTIAGGLVGRMEGASTYTGCYATGNILWAGVAGGTLGGFAGTIAYAVTISKCIATGNCTANNSTGICRLGGFVGDINDTGASSITESYAAGNVNAKETNAGLRAGGFVGELDGATTPTLITDCYATGNVCPDGTKAAYLYPQLGGFIGDTSYMFTLTNCYSAGSVHIGSPASTLAGGFAGKGNLDTTTFAACYWDTETSGWSISNGGTGKTTAEMKSESTYTDWDFTDTWIMPEV